MKSYANISIANTTWVSHAPFPCTQGHWTYNYSRRSTGNSLHHTTRLQIHLQTIGWCDWVVSMSACILYKSVPFGALSMSLVLVFDLFCEFSQPCVDIFGIRFLQNWINKRQYKPNSPRWISCCFSTALARHLRAEISCGFRGPFP